MLFVKMNGKVWQFSASLPARQRSDSGKYSWHEQVNYEKLGANGLAFFVSVYKTTDFEERLQLQMNWSRESDNRFKPALQLVGLTVLMVAVYVCTRTLRFTNDWFNLAFVGLFLLVPVLAIAIVILRLPSRSKVWTSVLLAPIVAISLVRFLLFVDFDIPAVLMRRLSRDLSTVQQGHYSVHLAWQETAGGALGPHGLLLEQRRTILPGLYAVKSLDYFEGATQGRLSFAGPNRVSLYIPIAGYERDQRNVQRIYSLKPWLYF